MAMIESSLQDTGLLITPYMAAYINLYADRGNLPQNIKELVEAGTFDAGADDVDHEANFVLMVEGYLDISEAAELLEERKIEVLRANEFTGKTISVVDPNQEDDFQADYIAYIPTSKPRSIFNDGYDTIDQVVAEFRAKLGHTLPPEFSYKRGIVNIIGTVLA